MTFFDSRFKHISEIPSLHFWRLGVTTIWLLVGSAAGLYAGMTRNTTADHGLPAFTQPHVDLSRYKSVQTRAGQDPQLALAVAISGGGHRAASFGAGVLLALEDIPAGENGRNLLQEVDYFSTVSGGGFPVAAYISSRLDFLSTRSEDDMATIFSFRRALEENDAALLYNLRRDYQTSLLQAGVSPECFGYFDAGDLMEEKFDRYLLNAESRQDERSLTLNDVFRATADPRPVHVPYWVMNATVYENGARFFFSPDVVQAYAVTGCNHRMKRVGLEGDPGRLPLAVGLKASASFPILIPATTLRCDPSRDKLNSYLHLVDGGLVDNFGIYTAFELLRQDDAKRKVLIVVDAYKGTSHPHSRWRASPTGPEMALRIMKISIDSAHNRLQRILRELQNSDGPTDALPVTVVVLSFDGLKGDVQKRIDAAEGIAARTWQDKARALVRRLNRELDNAVEANPIQLNLPKGAFDLYEDARAVGTTLYITEGQQALLLEAGRSVVEKHADALRDALQKNDVAKQQNEERQGE